jgi:hypothetical protein
LGLRKSEAGHTLTFSNQRDYNKQKKNNETLRASPKNNLLIPGGTFSIVVFGTNLKSTVGIKFTRAQLAMVKLVPYTRDIIIGLLLSDG